MSSRSYSTHLLLTPAYSLGFSGLYLVAIQVVTGLLLAANYQASDTASWQCIRTLARELSVGYHTLSIHANSAALLFAVIYLHMGRALFRSSTTSKPLVWLSGVVIYVLLIGTCFTGYSLVYGQMSMWAIVVICSLVTATPVIGPDLLTLVWGGSSVSTATIGRLFTVHYLLGLVVVALAVLHMTVLHNVGSSGSRDLVSTLPRSDRIDFMHAYLIRDATIALIVTATVGAVASWYPNVMGEADNFIPASPLITPACIVIVASLDSSTGAVSSWSAPVDYPCALGPTAFLGILRVLFVTIPLLTRGLYVRHTRPIRQAQQQPQQPFTYDQPDAPYFPDILPVD